MEEELNIITFEEFKNEISSKNDKIKNQSDMWWIELKSDLLYYADFSIGDTTADLVNILIVYLATNLSKIAAESLDGTGKALQNLNKNTFRLKRVSKKDIADFLAILLKYVKSTQGFNDVLNDRFAVMMRRGRDNEELPWPNDISDIIQQLYRSDIKDAYYNLFIESVKLMEYVVSKSYSRKWGNLEQYLDCYTLFHSIQKYYEVDEEGDHKYELFQNLDEYYMDLYKNKSYLTGGIEDFISDIEDMNDCIVKTERYKKDNKGTILAKDMKQLNDKISGCKKAMGEFTKKKKELEKKLDEVIKSMNDFNFPLTVATKEQIKDKYDKIYEDILKLGITDRRYGHHLHNFGMESVLDMIDKDKLIEQLKNIAKILEEIMVDKIFKDIMDKDLSKIIDQCMVTEIEIYGEILSIFIGSYKSLKDYYEDDDGRKSKDLANIDDYDFRDVVVCIENYINRAKYELLYSSNPNFHTTRLKFLYEDKEQELLQDSDEELEEIQKRMETVGERYRELKRGIFSAPDDYFKKGDYVLFRETRKDEMPWFTGEWNHLVPEGDNQMKFVDRIKPRISQEMDDDERSEELGRQRRANQESSEEELARSDYEWDRDLDDYGGGSRGGMEGNPDQNYYVNREGISVNNPTKIVDKKNETINTSVNLEPEPQGDDYDSDDSDYSESSSISDEEDFQSIDYIQEGFPEDCERDKAYYGIGKIMTIGKAQSINQEKNGTYCMIKWKRGYYETNPETGAYDESKKIYQNLFIVKPISAIKKTEDLLIYQEKVIKVKYGNWLEDKLLIDEMRGTPTSEDIYGFRDLFPWPTGEAGDNYKLSDSYNISDEELKKLNPWNIYDKKEGPVVLGKAVKELNEITGINSDKLFGHKTNPDYLTEFRMGGLSEYLDEVFGFFVNQPENKTTDVTGEIENNLNYRIDSNPYEAIVDLFQSFDPTEAEKNNRYLPELKSFIEEFTKTGIQYSKYNTNTSLKNYITPGTGKLIEIRIPDMWPFNNIAYGIAFIEAEVFDIYGQKTEQKVILQRLLRNIDIDYASTEEIRKKSEELTMLDKIEEQYQDLNIEGQPTQYIDNPFRKNKDVYNKKLKELGMDDIFQRMLVQQKTNFKDKEIKMLQYASKKAKKSTKPDDLTLAPEYLKWMEYVTELDAAKQPYSEGDEPISERMLPKGVSTRDVDFGPEEFDDRIRRTQVEQPDQIELEYLDSLGIDKQSVLLDPDLLEKKSLRQYDMSLGPGFRGARDLRRDILSRRIPSDESSESRRRRTQTMNRLVSRIDSERELNRINRESRALAQMRADAYVSTDEEDDPQGLANMFDSLS